MKKHNYIDMSYEELFDLMSEQIKIIKEANIVKESASGFIARKMLLEDKKEMEIRNRHIIRHESKKLALPDEDVIQDICSELIPSIDSVELMNYLDFNLAGFNKLMGNYPEYSKKLTIKFPHIHVNVGKDRACVMRYNRFKR